MGETYVITDLHLGHKNLVKNLRTEWKSVEDHDEAIIDLWNATVTKRDIIIMLGDIVWKGNQWRRLTLLKGMKKLVMGNHDRFNIHDAAQYLHSVHGSIQKEDIIFTHIPIHPQELEYRWNYNVHGHTHENSVNDWRYLNMCPEKQGYAPVHIDAVKAQLENRRLERLNGE